MATEKRQRSDLATRAHTIFYEATVTWDRDYRGVYVMESENQFLPGTNLFRGSTLTVQMWAGGNVVID